MRHAFDIGLYGAVRTRFACRFRSALGRHPVIARRCPASTRPRDALDTFAMPRNASQRPACGGDDDDDDAPAPAPARRLPAAARRGAGGTYPDVCSTTGPFVFTLRSRNGSPSTCPCSEPCSRSSERVGLLSSSSTVSQIGTGPVKRLTMAASANVSELAPCITPRRLGARAASSRHRRGVAPIAPACIVGRRVYMLLDRSPWRRRTPAV